jgi:DNA-directed RNA polymerase specialized sigma24 family protein
VFHASAYPQLAAQTLAITGNAGITRAATETTLARVWRSWPSLRQAPDLLVRARWTAVLIAAERESAAPSLTADAVQASVGELTGANELGEACADIADTVVVTAMQRLPRVQRRALVLHYMGGVSVVDMAALSGSSAEHIELLLDDGFTALAESLVWPRRDAGFRGPDLRFDLAAELLADTAARLPERIAAPPPSALLRHAAVAHLSIRVMPVALGAACAAVIAAVVQPTSPDLRVPATIYAEHGAVGGPVGDASGDAAQPDVVPGPSSAATRPGPMVRMRSIALNSLLDAADRENSSHDGGVDASGDARMRRSQLGSTAVSSTGSSAASSVASGGTAEPSAKGQAAPSASERSSGRPDASTGTPVAASPGRSSVEANSSSPAAGTPSDPAAGTPSDPATGTPSGAATGATTSPAHANLAAGAGGPIDAVPSGPTAGADALPGLVDSPETSAQAPSPTPIAAPLGAALATDPSATVLTTADQPTTGPRPKAHAADPPITYDAPTAVEEKSTPEPSKPTSEETAAKKHQAADPADGGDTADSGDKAEHSATTDPAADG